MHNNSISNLMLDKYVTIRTFSKILLLNAQGMTFEMNSIFNKLAVIAMNIFRQNGMLDKRNTKQ